MVNVQPFRRPFLSRPGSSCAAPDLASLRELCFTLLADVPASDRNAMLRLLEKLRRADDIRILRGALFDTIARFHGEAVAHERLTRLDERLP